MRFIDSLRELLLPALALTILATLWAVAKARACEEDLERSVPPAPLALMTKVGRAQEELPPPASATARTTSPEAEHR